MTSQHGHEGEDVKPESLAQEVVADWLRRIGGRPGIPPALRAGDFAALERSIAEAIRASVAARSRHAADIAARAAFVVDNNYWTSAACYINRALKATAEPADRP